MIDLAAGGPVTGSLVGLDAAGVHWKSAAGEAQVFKLSEIARVIPGTAALPAGAAQPTVLVRLADGDELPGVLQSLDGKTLVLETWYAGKLSIPREAVACITTYNGDAVYTGPAGLDGWEQSQLGTGAAACWSWNAGVFSPSGAGDGSIGRDVGLPAKSEVAFDLLARNKSVFGVNLYAGKRAAGVQLCFVFSPDYVSQIMVMRFQPALPLKIRPLGQAVTLGPGWVGAKMHVVVRSDKDLKTLALYINGTLIKVFNGDKDFGSDGAGIAFYATRTSNVSVSNIKTGPWDGVDANAPAPTEDAIE
ncbi:MAG TPA: hypothetical protein VG733_00005, partial [Chthoniobacteraceae bacterium]|nr:hypothetical protein [Chthoniobacteraceae bacterium]